MIVRIRMSHLLNDVKRASQEAAIDAVSEDRWKQMTVEEKLQFAVEARLTLWALLGNYTILIDTETQQVTLERQ